MFKLISNYKPTGDQPQAIEYLSKGIQDGKKFQTFQGVTGSGVREYNLPIYFVKDVLGYERPKGNILLLIKQRIRWPRD